MEAKEKPGCFKQLLLGLTGASIAWLMMILLIFICVAAALIGPAIGNVFGSIVDTVVNGTPYIEPTSVPVIAPTIFATVESIRPSATKTWPAIVPEDWRTQVARSKATYGFDPIATNAPGDYWWLQTTVTPTKQVYPGWEPTEHSNDHGKYGDWKE